MIPDTIEVAGTQIAEMAESQAAEQTNTSRPKPRTPRRGGRGRGGHGHVANNTQGESSHGRTRQRPQTDVQAQQTMGGESSTPQNAAGEGSSSRRRRPPRARGRGGGSGPRRNGQERGGNQEERQSTTRTTGIGGRTFGRGLTRDEHCSEGAGETPANGSHERDETEGHELRADAPEFVPGQKPEEGPSAPAPSSGAPSSTKTKSKTPKTPRPQPKPKVTTKSVAPDLPTRIHEDIANNLYECPICASELGRKSRVWSCRLCWSVFHLSCIKKWSKNEGSVFHSQQQQGGNGVDAPRQWRCPGCNLPQDVLPSTYSCWCEKEIDPRSLPGLPPHSCGQTCSRPRKGCPHPCDSTCHAGPCPPCTAMGPTQDCFCGKNSSSKRCVDTDYVNGWSCGEICGDLLPCGEHTCPRPCHEGLCGACEVKVDARCYCGRLKTQMLCSSKDEEIPSGRLPDGSSSETDPEEWIGSFNCGEICNRPFDCGVHFCQKSCHPQDAAPPHCPRSPDVVLRCPCGKTLLEKIPGFTGRTSCEDPIPNCQEPCRKILPCGHECPMVCHTGPCRPCLRTVSIKCRCGRGEFSTICHQGSEEPPQCFRVCKAAMNCGRHSCAERCCPGERKALERQATRRKLKSLNAANRSTDDDIEAEHICTRVCGRTLKCEKHTCPDLCHKGSCGTCREAIFEEISCNCGRSVLHPPLPCGTKPPPCRFECERPKPCGHPQTPHNCHTDEESCPKCPFLTEKTCLCGKRVLKNQPCWLTDARCGLVCGEPLKCGSHTCLKHCHRPGDCEDAVTPCRQACGKTKTLCGHPCTEPCHAPFACPEKTPCSTTVTVTCACGRLRQEKRCNAAKAVTTKGQTQQQRLPSLGPLECDDECLRLERNRNLASALNIDIDPSTTSVNPASSRLLSSTNLPYSAETLDMYIQLSSSATLATLQNYESTLDSLARSSTQRSVRFQPAKAPLRAFVHSLAADWGFATESFDPEPHRHVFVLKPTSWAPPLFGLGTGNGMGIGGMTVGECVKVRDRERMKEREAQRAAAVEAKALRDAANAAASSGAEVGWAQVASRKRPSTDATNNAAKTWGAPPPSNGPTYGSYAALAADSGSGSGTTNSKPRDRLVLRSGVAQKKLQTQMEEVADSWEEEVEKEEEEEKKIEQQESGRASLDQEKESLDVDVGDVEKKLDDLRLRTAPEEGAGVTAGGDGAGN